MGIYSSDVLWGIYEVFPWATHHHLYSVNMYFWFLDWKTVRLICFLARWFHETCNGTGGENCIVWLIVRNKKYNKCKCSSADMLLSKKSILAWKGPKRSKWTDFFLVRRIHETCNRTDRRWKLHFQEVKYTAKYSGIYIMKYKYKNLQFLWSTVGRSSYLPRPQITKRDVSLASKVSLNCGSGLLLWSSPDPNNEIASQSCQLWCTISEDPRKLMRVPL